MERTDGNKMFDKQELASVTKEKERWKEALEKFRKAAGGQENLMPYLFRAVKAYTTNEEIPDTLREVFGEYKATTIV